MDQDPSWNFPLFFLFFFNPYRQKIIISFLSTFLTAIWIQIASLLSLTKFIFLYKELEIENGLLCKLEFIWLLMRVYFDIKLIQISIAMIASHFFPGQKWNIYMEYAIKEA